MREQACLDFSQCQSFGKLQSTLCRYGERVNPKKMGGQKGANTYIALAGVEDLLVTAEEDISDAPRALESVCSGCKGKG